ncbi:hypothetical protein E4U21_001569 [Claviceps maximensis]|nr:hypothetical protein E4U21_001569 [Claviceps maximensis]
MIDISSTHQFDTLLRQKPRLVANFTSTYCKPCGFITPKYAQLATQYRNTLFVMVDVDVAGNKALATRYAVTGMPTFLMFRSGRKVDECFGLDEGALEGRVKKLAS